MNWFYSDNGQQKGPISDMEFSIMAREGKIAPDTLVWREGLPDWQPLLQVRPDLAPLPSSSPSLGGVSMAGQNKDLLVQQMREGVLPGNTIPGTTQYVGFWWRVLARFIDGLVVAAAGCVIALPLAFMVGAAAANAGSASGLNGTTQIIGQIITNAVSFLVTAFYYTWMTGKYGATLGKMALGFKVVTEDGVKPSYARSFGRWAADQLLSGTICLIIILIPVVLVIVLGVGGFQQLAEANQEALGAWILAMVGAGLVGSLVGSFPWWMAAFDPEKRALHDRVCATRVVRK